MKWFIYQDTHKTKGWCESSFWSVVRHALGGGLARCESWGQDVWWQWFVFAAAVRIGDIGQHRNIVFTDYEDDDRGNGPLRVVDCVCGGTEGRYVESLKEWQDGLWHWFEGRPRCWFCGRDFSGVFRGAFKPNGVYENY